MPIPGELSERLRRWLAAQPEVLTVESNFDEPNVGPGVFFELRGGQRVRGQLQEVGPKATACGHENWALGHCAEMVCWNYVNKHLGPS
jgi:hypothetical protein